MTPEQLELTDAAAQLLCVLKIKRLFPECERSATRLAKAVKAVQDAEPNAKLASTPIVGIPADLANYLQRLSPWSKMELQRWKEEGKCRLSCASAEVIGCKDRSGALLADFIAAVRAYKF